MVSEKKFRSKAPELLIELAYYTSDTISQTLKISPELAAQIGEAVASRMLNTWGGQNIYFPMGLTWKLSERDREIYRAFNGHNHNELAKQFGLSVQWVYRVIKRARQEKSKE